MASFVDKSMASGDGGKVVNAITANLAAMLEQISQQIAALGDLCSKADVTTKQNDAQRHRELMDLVISGNKEHGNHFSSIGRSMNDSFSGVTRSINELPIIEALHSVNSLEQRLLTLEKNGQEKDKLLGRILDTVQGIDSKIVEGTQRSSSSEIHAVGSKMVEKCTELHVGTRAFVADGNRALFDEMQSLARRCDSLASKTELSCIKGWLDDHASEVYQKLDEYCKTQDALTKHMEGMPEQASLLTEVGGQMAKQLEEHGKGMSAAFQRVAIAAKESMLEAVERSEENIVIRIGTVKDEGENQSKSLVTKADEHSKRINDLQALLEDFMLKCCSTSSSPLSPSKTETPRALDGSESVKDSLDDHAKGVYNMLEAQSQRQIALADLLEKRMPDPEKLMRGVDRRLSDHAVKMTSEVQRLLDSIGASDKQLLRVMGQTDATADLCGSLGSLWKAVGNKASGRF